MAKPLTKAQQKVLSALWKKSYTMDELSKLAKKVGSSQSGVMRTLKSLSKRRLVQIPQGRERKIRLTAENKRRAEKLMPKLQKQAVRIPIRRNPPIPLNLDKEDFQKAAKSLPQRKNKSYEKIRRRLINIAKKIGIKKGGYSKAASKVVAIMNVNKNNAFGRAIKKVYNSLKKDPKWTQYSLSKGQQGRQQGRVIKMQQRRKKKQSRKRAAAGRRRTGQRRRRRRRR